ncbi:LAME_0E08834g1_1 [Lachancea meyersii CBS 8951]|uniref:LAME_0E08834g1_1 n=1 Tax=Lachancea meyersii CBS 8951 TaxID=1266667 RepID=A0A1G4JJ35_9SACH|nr:LAME_0E08834g1_1 [Lachancea meyersii CBS 8951]
MLGRRFRKVVARPFENLSASSRLIQFFRLGSSTLVIVFAMILTVGALACPDRLFMGQMNTSSIDIANGLFQFLESSVESSTANYISNGVGLTTSEILILTEYTSLQSKAAPQYVVSSVYGWCRVENRTTTTTGPRAQNYTTCTTEGSDYIFDYRSLMKGVGLEVILDYAYNASGDDTYEANPSYTHYMNSKRSMKGRMIVLLYIVAACQALVLFLTLWYYSIKGRSLNQFRESLLVHTISILSLLVCICALVSTILLVTLNVQLRSKIKDELSVMGISYHLGRAWFAALCLMAIFSCISCANWSGLVWCITNGAANKEESYELGILASAAESIQEFSSEQLDTDLSRPQKPFLSRNDSSRAGILDADSIESQNLVVRTDTDTSNALLHKPVVPTSAFNL